MNLSLLKTNKFNFINPLTWIGRWYKRSTKTTEFKLHYDLRNSITSIKPFLDAIGCKYDIVLQELIIVEASNDVLAKLDKLGFKTIFECTESSRYFNSLKKLTQGLFVDILYHSQYNFELYIIPANRWNAVETTKALQKRLKTKESEMFRHFMIIFQEVIGIVDRVKS